MEIETLWYQPFAVQRYAQVPKGERQQCARENGRQRGATWTEHCYRSHGE